MKAGSSKEKIIVRLSLAILLGIGGYFGIKKLRKLKDEKAEAEAERLKNESNNSETPVITPSNDSNSATETALAIAYRTWANSTDALSKKYGKKSSYDLDATSKNPTKGTFSKSYAVGKNEFDKYNQSMSKPNVDNSKPSATNQTIFNAIAASTSQPVKRLANGVSYITIPVSAKGFRKILKIADGQIPNGTFSPSSVVYYLYDTNWTGNITGNSIAKGFVRINNNGKYDVTGGGGIGNGSKITGASTLATGISGVVGFTIILYS